MGATRAFFITLVVLFAFMAAAFWIRPESVPTESTSAPLTAPVVDGNETGDAANETNETLEPANGTPPTDATNATPASPATTNGTSGTNVTNVTTP